MAENSSVFASDVTVAGDHVFIASGHEGLWILETFRPVRLEASPELAGGELRLRVHGTPGLNFLIQRSADLKDWQDWRTVTLDAGPAVISDPDAAIAPRSFYRAVAPRTFLSQKDRYPRQPEGVENRFSVGSGRFGGEEAQFQ